MICAPPNYNLDKENKTPQAKVPQPPVEIFSPAIREKAKGKSMLVSVIH